MPSRPSSFTRATVPLLSLVVMAVSTACTHPDAAQAEAVGAAASAVVTTGLFTTGVDGTGAVVATNGTVTDLHYTIVDNGGDPAVTVGSHPYVVSPDANAGAWAKNTTTGAWLSTFASTRAADGVNDIYTYETTFQVPVGIDPAMVLVSGNWACDDSCTLKLNGTLVATGAAQAGNLVPFAIPEGLGFKTGPNTLDFVVNNSGGYETGLLVTLFTMGCTADGQCRSGEFCDTGTGACSRKLVNGTLMPPVIGHTPDLSGTCTSLTADPEAPVVCVSGVCDTKDNKCGYQVGEGCTAAAQCRSQACGAGNVCVTSCNLDADCNTASEYCDTSIHGCASKIVNGLAMPTLPSHTPALSGACGSNASDIEATIVCISGVCDTNDSKCGYQTGDSCTTSSQCRSTVCAGNVCIAGCFADTDCNAASQFCDLGNHVCDNKLANGTPMPTLSGRIPALGGTCTSNTADPEAVIVCTSGVCDTKDNLCGYQAGDACTASTQCRLGTCGTGNVCVSPGCSTDSDCSSLQYCDTSQHACAAKLTNGTALPTVAGHTPDLNGTCTTAVAVAVCASGVCDAKDNKCGLADGDGPCSAATGTTVCRTQSCNTTSGLCGASQPGGCTADSSCTTEQWCNTSTGVCTAKLPNGSQIPTVAGHTPGLTGACSVSVATAVCASGVCDTTDNACGIVNGNGTCQAGAQCRSGACDTADQKCGLLPGHSGCSADNTCRSTSCVLATQTCASSPTGGACTSDQDCTKTEYCTGAGQCTPKLEAGQVCQARDQCLSNVCLGQICNNFVASGNGFRCAAAAPQDGQGAGHGGLLWLGVVALGLLGRRSRAARPKSRHG